MNNLTLLINEIKAALNIEGGIYIDGMIRESLEGVKEEDYQEFFNSLMGDDHAYLKPLDRVAKVAERFKASTANELFEGTRDMAKAMYDKFYAINATMTTYTQNNRDTIPNDRVFFENFDYKNMKDPKNHLILSKQELYTLNELGGGTWLMNIKFIMNSKEAVDKIESIIKSAITKSFMMKKSDNAIAGNVRKMIGKAS